jgi:hypothetical protein
MIFVGFSFAVTNAVLFLTARDATQPVIRPVVAIHHVAEWKPEKRALKHVVRKIESLHASARHADVPKLVLRAATVAGRSLARQSRYVLAKLRSEIDIFRPGRVQIVFHEVYAVATQCFGEPVASRFEKRTLGIGNLYSSSDS